MATKNKQLTGEDLKKEIRTVFKTKASNKGLHIDDITKEILGKKDNADLFNQSELTESEIKARVGRILSANVRTKEPEFARVPNGKGGYRNGTYRLKSSVRPIASDIEPVEEYAVDMDTPNISNYVGTAGECAVMSELLYRGYNVNSMLVDEGVDIVANKNDKFYYIQVKTTKLDENYRIIVPAIKTDRFEKFSGDEMKYIVVVRCKIKKELTNIYFVFSRDDLNRMIYEKQISVNSAGISIKIRLNPETSEFEAYNGTNSTSINYYKNKFAF